MDTAFSSPLQLVAWLALAALAVWLAIKLLSGVFALFAAIFRGIGRFFRHIFRFIGGIIVEGVRLVGCACAVVAYAAGWLFSEISGRRSAATHYDRAVRAEIFAATRSCYRLVFGHLMGLLCLDRVNGDLEQRVADVFAQAPGPDGPATGAGAFAGYRVTGSLQGGGSGARLFLAEPDAEKRRQLERAAAPGVPIPVVVVIKSFSLNEGSTLPQIVRENRALAAARDLGLVLEHELTASRFFYVMPYVPGDDLGRETTRLHAATGGGGATGLDAVGLARAMGYTDDLLSTLERFHTGGLWHKDVKPSNIIVSNGRAHLVDFGLITPLRSAMTLTTHGTEYFRDPEMVRLALRGVKVHEVDGIKFDIYGAGAVLYSLIENGFPAHGSLSRITRRCPEALRWIIRRAMADMANRYGSATEMLKDLRVVSRAADPFAVKPAELPSLAGRPRVAEALAGAADASAAPGSLRGDTGDAVDSAGAVDPDAGGIGAGRADGAGAAGTALSAGAGDTGRSVPGAAPSGGPSSRGPLSHGPLSHGPSSRGPLSHGLSSRGPSSGTFSSRERDGQPLARPRQGRPVSRKLVAAGIIAALFLTGVFFDDNNAGQLDDTFGARSADDARAPLVSSLATDSEAGKQSRLANAQLADAHFRMLEPVSLDRLPPQDEGALSPPLPQPLLGTVLVLDDLPANADEARVTAVDGMCARLRAARYALLGTSAVADADTEVALLAGARSAAGLADPSDPEAVRRLSGFLAAQDDTLDAILWIGRAEDADPVHTRVITRNETVARALSAVLGGRRAD